MAAKSNFYTNKLMLAPMVRINTLPMRLLALKYGADLVYTEEIIDFKLLNAQKRINEFLGTVDFIDPSDGSLIFRTCDIEKKRLIFQIGTACPERALQAAKKIENEVAGIDINMGCPKEFSVKGGMGVSLMYNQANAISILKTLVENVNKPITCKIRIMEKIEDTIELAKKLAATGISAIAVHGRTRNERSRHTVHTDYIRKISEELEIPVIANGGSNEILNYPDLNRFKEQCNACSVMVARAAEWNCSIFKKDGLLPLNDVITEYLKLCVDYDNPPNNTKYCVQNMLRSLQETPMGKKFLESHTTEQMCELWGLKDYCRQKQQMKVKFGNVERRSLIADNESLKKKNKLIDELIQHKTIFLRSNYHNDTTLPKSQLHLYCAKNFKKVPKYEIIQEQKLFKAILTLDGKKYSSLYWEKNKRYAEQGAALACLLELGIVDSETLKNNESLVA